MPTNPFVTTREEDRVRTIRDFASIAAKSVGEMVVALGRDEISGDKDERDLAWKKVRLESDIALMYFRSVILNQIDF